MHDVVHGSIQEHQPVADAGIAIAVLKDRTLHCAGGFGFRDRAASLPVDEQTSFPIGSATKAFTSMALSMLAEQGGVSLDVPIIRYLPDFALQDAEAQNDANLKDVFSHAIGIPPHDSLWYLSPLSRRQLFHALRYLEPRSSPGQGFRKSFEYNNMTYGVAAAVLESVSGQRFDDFLRNRIFQPLGMRQTTLSLDEFRRADNRSKGYAQAVELPLKDFDNIGPSAMINSNVLDMAKWVSLHLKGGAISNGTRIIGAHHIGVMHSHLVDVGSNGGYGLGWRVTSTKGRKLIFHAGNADGHSAYVSFMPDNGLGVVALTNQHASDFPCRVASDIYEHLLQEPVDDIRSVSEFVDWTCALPALQAAEQPAGFDAAASQQPATTGQQSATTGAGPALTYLSEYSGMYSHPAYGDLSIGVCGTNLLASYYDNLWTLSERPGSNPPTPADGFDFAIRAYGKEFPLTVDFVRNASGRIDRLKILLERMVKEIEFVRQ